MPEKNSDSSSAAAAESEFIVHNATSKPHGPSFFKPVVFNAVTFFLPQLLFPPLDGGRLFQYLCFHATPYLALVIVLGRRGRSLTTFDATLLWIGLWATLIPLAWWNPFRFF